MLSRFWIQRGVPNEPAFKEQGVLEEGEAENSPQQDNSRQ